MLHQEQTETQQTTPNAPVTWMRSETTTPASEETMWTAYAEQLMVTVQNEARKFRRNRAMTRAGLLCFGILAGFMVLLFVGRGVSTGRWDYDMLSSFGAMTGIFSMAAAATKDHKAAASKLAELDEIRAVGPLAESLDIEDKNVRAVIETGLIRLLPRLQISDSALLNTEQRACLNRALNGRNEPLTIAILRAYEQVGDEHALPVVEELTRETAESKRSLQVRAAAQTCLPYLQERAAQHRASQTLLRAASANEVAPDTLLRATTSQSSPIVAEQLLRSSTSTAKGGDPL